MLTSTLPCFLNKQNVERQRDAGTFARSDRSPRNKRSRFEIWKSRRCACGARGEGGGRRRPIASERAQTVTWRGEPPRACAARYYLFYKNVIFFLSFSPRPFNRQRKLNERARKLRRLSGYFNQR